MWYNYLEKFKDIETITTKTIIIDYSPVIIEATNLVYYNHLNILRLSLILNNRIKPFHLEDINTMLSAEETYQKTLREYEYLRIKFL